MDKQRLRLLSYFFLAISIVAIILGSSGYITLGSQGPGGSVWDLLPNYAALFTSVITFMGFIVTTILSIKRERRDARDAQLAQKQKEIELEKAQLEIELLKKQIEKKKK